MSSQDRRKNDRDDADKKAGARRASDAPSDREARLADALRENLRRRKAAARNKVEDSE